MDHVGVFHGEMKLIVCNIAVASSHALNYLEEWTGNLTSEGERIEKNSMSSLPQNLGIDRPYTRIEKSIITKRRGSNIFCAIIRFLNLWLRCHWTIYNYFSLFHFMNIIHGTKTALCCFVQTSGTPISFHYLATL